MRTYTVKQIADMFNTNPETVRRWIRQNKLNAQKSSYKSGNVISDVELQRFIKTAPKYAPLYAAATAAAVASPALSIPLLLGTLLGSTVLTTHTPNPVEHTHVIDQQTAQDLLDQVNRQKKQLEEKLEEMKKLEKELEELRNISPFL